MLDIVYRIDPSASPPALPRDSAEARQRLVDGNREFAELTQAALTTTVLTQRIIPSTLADLGLGATLDGIPVQRPFAAVLGCADARVPVELVFHRAANELFVVRVAGNVVGTEGLGSLDYAVQHLRESLKLIVVLGHSSCGAVSAAVDAYLAPAHYPELAFSHPLRSVIDPLMVTVRGAANAIEQSWGPAVANSRGYRKALTEVAVTLNAALNALTLQRELPTAGATGMQVAYGVFNLANRAVGLPHHPTAADGKLAICLSDPPANPEEFKDLAAEVVHSDVIRRILEVEKPPAE